MVLRGLIKGTTLHHVIVVQAHVTCVKKHQERCKYSTFTEEKKVVSLSQSSLFQ